MNAGGYRYCLNLLRERDPDRHLTVLWLPEAQRGAAAAIYAFAAEISRIPAMIEEPANGEIRLQWWSEVVAGKGDHGGQPVVGEVLAVLQRHNLPAAPLLDLIEASRFDLYRDAMPDLTALEAYAGHVASAPLQLTALCAGQRPSADLADACGHAGVAYQLAELCRTAGAKRAAGRCCLPPELLSPCNLDAESFVREAADQRHLQAVLALAELAGKHLKQARAAIEQLERSTAILFLALCMVEPTLGAVGRAGISIFSAVPEIAPLRRHWRFLRAALTLRP